MAGFNPFIGKSQAWLEAELAKAQEDLARGKSTSSIGAGDVSKGSVIQLTPLQRIKYIYQALYLLDPTTYPDENLPSNTTRIVYSGDASSA